MVLLPRSCRNNSGLGCFAFARRYLRNHYCFLFLRLLRCFSSPGSPPPYGGCLAFNQTGCPIRKSADQLVCANPRGLSQLITSFFASESLGIPHTPFVTFTFSYNVLESISCLEKIASFFTLISLLILLESLFYPICQRSFS